MLVAVLAFGLIKVRVSSSEVRVSSSGYRSTYLLYLLGGDLEELDDLRVILPDGQSSAVSPFGKWATLLASAGPDLSLPLESRAALLFGRAGRASIKARGVGCGTIP